MTTRLRGVIAAITTPFQASGAPDAARFVARARALLENGCDGLNVLGTTGEATSLSVAQRVALMDAAADALPLKRMMVGTGAAALDDAVRLTFEAAEIGFAGALLLPPFYYKPLSDDGLLRFFDALAEASRELPLYLYNFPALTGIVYTPELVKLLIARFGDRIAGLKDSSGDLAYATSIAALSPKLAVFPSNEGTLLQARNGGPFAGCISATANLNATDCAAAFHHGDEAALSRAVAVRQIFDGLPLVPGVKALVGHAAGDGAHCAVLPPLHALSAEQASTLADRYEAATGVKGVRMVWAAQ
jgi:4-hydroxy-tetrahydrodipicolinate synthase